ncbi:MAG: response regulator [Ruminococcus sp.]|jgi:signal transduction histidine kinase/DNA-binding response OmpR family regulator|nr:response regulator [Ruminococcus sp.]
MKKRLKISKKGSLLISIILVFGILGAVVFSVARKTSAEMSASAINNLSDSLVLVKGTVEAILVKEAEFQEFIAQEIAISKDPYEIVRSYKANQTIAKVSLILEGETEGISSMGEVFSESALDFSTGKKVGALPLSQSYLNDMGTWAYTMKCPVMKNDKEIAALYIEYTFDSFERTFPENLYDGRAMLYIMDSKSERLVLKPTGMGERDAGHLNLADFYRANNIMEDSIQTKVAETIRAGDNIMFYHDIRNKNALIYMWAVNDGAYYLIGYVPIEAIQQEGRSVNQNILTVVLVMLIAFFLCCILYYISQKQQETIRKERETEREIHNKQLAEALQAAQIASNSKTTFLSNMSHDIRTPMNAILGFTTLLSKDADDPVKVREYTKKITSSGQHLLSLINDVLDVSKIESGKMVLNVGEFTLNDLVSSVDAIIRPMAKEKAQNFHVTVTDINHEYLIGDETRINQILINLLSNSVKYTPVNGNIWFRIIGQKQRSAQYEHIRIEVEDDGYGMTPEFLETIFDAFTRAENSTTNKVQGTGLGMAITKNIVELMGGTIDVSSEVDKGSLFRVDLELRVPSEQSDGQFWKESGITRILAVDHSAEACKCIRTLMKDTGISVDTASSGKEALQMAWHAHDGGACYQAVLLDSAMTDMDGAEAVGKLREIISDSIPILFLTACDGDDMHAKYSIMKNVGLLTKPFFVSAFKEALLGMQLTQGDDKPESEAEGHDVLNGLHFLAAEDNEINAEILSELLDIEGAACEIVENGQLALERFERAGVGEFDAILMDVQMPVMNGYEASEKIRLLQRPDAKSIPIIAMTANAFAEDVKDALNAGMNAHVAKPIDMDILKKTIYQYIP